MDEDIRSRLYEAYSTTHAGVSTGTSGEHSFRQGILPHLPASKDAEIVDLGCGQGQLVQQLLTHGYQNSRGIDISPEQVELAHAAGITQVELGDYREGFRGNSLDVVTATDFFEHLTKSEVLEALDRIHDALRAGGILVLRVPNSVSPFGGDYRYGDITHETSFNARSLRQLGAAARFASVEAFACTPPIHGAKSFARAALWKVVSGGMKTVLAAETGAVRGHYVTQNVVAVMRKAD